MPAGVGSVEAAGHREVPERTRIAARNAAVVAAAEVAGKVATLAFMVAAARILGRSGFGAFSFAPSFSHATRTFAELVAKHAPRAKRTFII